MAKAKKTVKKLDESIIIGGISTKTLEILVVGDSPLIMNAMSAKTKQELLLPKRKKTKADKEQSLKHDPMVEFRDSCYKRKEGEKGATRIIFPAVSLKSAMAGAAKEAKGTSSTQIGRLVWTEGDYLDVFGVPEFYMTVVRTADIKRTPDIRSRAIIKKWCLKFKITYVTPQLNTTTLKKLINMSGVINGIGDFRQEKGKGNYGRYHIVTDPKEVKDILADGGMKAQDKALKNPGYYDEESKELMEWYIKERKARGM